jgi:hypothetical protein
MTFLLSEDKALRELLQGLTVSDQKSDNSETPRPVGVWFGQPDQELRNQNYPYMTIDMIDVDRDVSREMRGKVNNPYLEPTFRRLKNISDDEEIEAWEMDRPIPVNIDYQITTYARHPRHDRELLAKVLYDRLPFRFGTLNCDDNTVRRLDVLNVTKRDVTEQAKRLFVNAITVRVSSEIVQGKLDQLYKVLQVNLDDPTNERSQVINGEPTFVGPGSFTNPNTISNL